MHVRIDLSTFAEFACFAIFDEVRLQIETTISLLAIAAKGRDGILAVAEDAQIVEYDVTRV